jgi:hypothetical protein
MNMQLLQWALPPWTSILSSGFSRMMEAKSVRLPERRPLNTWNYFITPHHRTVSGTVIEIDLRAIMHSREYHDQGESLSARSAPKRAGHRTEASMIKYKLGRLAAVLLAATVTLILVPDAYASNETASKPWSAPVGHRQPRAVDIPAGISASQQLIDLEEAIVDRKIKGVCRGC